jgi:putative ABC transport system substrate-binding protein
MSYGPIVPDAYRQQSTRVAQGAKPADLLVVQSTTFDFVINLRTIRALGLDLPSLRGWKRAYSLYSFSSC